MIDRIRKWWFWHKPIIMTRKSKYELLNKMSKHESELINHSVWVALRPLISDMDKFRANTWDQDKISFWQDYLRDNFEVKDE